MGPSWLPVKLCVLLASSIACVQSVVPLTAQALPREQFTPITAEVLSTPQPFPGSDGRRHIAYELMVSNVLPIGPGDTPYTVTIKSVRTLGEGRVLNSLAGDELNLRSIPFGATEPGATLSGGRSGFILMDVSLPLNAKLPKRLVHRFRVSVSPPNPVSVSTYRAGPTRVETRPPPIIAPPLRGSGWVVGNGCCSDLTSHRLAVLGVDGGIHASERFAIDFIQLRPDGHLLDGPIDRLSSYPFFGDPIRSVAPGRVVGIQKGLPETQPDLSLPPSTAWRAGGNYVVVRLSKHRYAFYAHLQPGSARVKIGDRVKTGQVLGLLGSSGNSNFPHLHFHLMDGPEPLASNGIPYRFRKFGVQGRLENFGGVVEGEEASLSRHLKGPKRSRMPMNLQVLNFGS